MGPLLDHKLKEQVHQHQGCQNQEKTKANEQPPEILRFGNRGPGLLTNRKNGYAQFLWIQGLSHALTEHDSRCGIHGLRIPH